MDAWFDTLAKDSNSRLSRRQVFGRVAGGFGVAVLGLFGFARTVKADNCGKACEECCKNNFPAGSGDKGYGECVSSCHKGEGICGPIVCPQ